MKGLFVIFLFLLSNLVGFAQKRPAPSKASFNLVANGDFQNINTCTEFEAVCEPEAWFFLPIYIVEPQSNGNNKYEAISVGNVFFGARAGSYFYTKLLCPLKKGNRYKFSIWVASPVNEFHHLDVLFRYLEPTSVETMSIINEPSLTVSARHVDSTKPRWKKYSQVYTATGEERFLILGNFTNTPFDKKTVASNKQGDILYAIDNITFTPLDPKEEICNEYDAVIKQLYDQNLRHPAKLSEKAALDSTLFKGYKKQNNPYVQSANDTVELVITKRDTLIIPDILFNFNSSKLNPAFLSKLEVVTNAIRSKNYKRIEITGHTDNVGSDAFNEQLSFDRANAIKQFILSKLSIDETKFEVRGLGETQPIDNNVTGIGRKRNRRVELILKD